MIYCRWDRTSCYQPGAGWDSTWHLHGGMRNYCGWLAYLVVHIKIRDEAIGIDIAIQ